VMRRFFFFFFFSSFSSGAGKCSFLRTWSLQNTDCKNAWNALSRRLFFRTAFADDISSLISRIASARISCRKAQRKLSVQSLLYRS
jgi:hypothetical protein